VKIRDIRTHILKANLSRPFAFSQWWYNTRMAFLVEIETDEGIIGWGECYGPPWVLQAVVNEYRPFLIDRNPLDRDVLWNWLYNRFRDCGQKGVIVGGLSGIDIALWDIAGKYFGVPVYQLMGGAVRTKISAYATGIYRIQDEHELELLQAEAASYVKMGFRAVKIKVGFGLGYDIVLVRAIREAIGPNIDLMIDANHAYDSVHALRLAREVEECNIEWFEEPVPPEDRAGYRYVRLNSSIPIAGGECEFTRYGFRDLILSESVDIIQPDTCSAGGLSECIKIATMASTFGVRYIPHIWGTSIALAANLHLLAWLPDNPISMNPIPPMLEFDCTEHPFRFEIVEEPPKLEKGMVIVPNKPGLGIEVNRKHLDKFKV